MRRGPRSRARRYAVCFTASSACLFSACGATDVIADVSRDAAVAEAGASAGVGAAQGGRDASATGAVELAAWCRGEAALWTVRPDGQSGFECASQLAARSFGNALCVCNTLTGPGTVATASIAADGSLKNSGAAIAVNGAIGANGTGAPAMSGAPAGSSEPTLPSFTQVGGDLVLAGTAPLRLAPGSQRVIGDLRSRALLSASPQSTSLRIDGDAWLPLGSALAPQQLDVGGELVLSDASLPQPCACGARQTLDVAATVAWAADHNDNAQLGFAPERLYWVENATTLALPCGRYHFDTINGTGVLTLRIDQPVALFVGDLQGFIEIDLGPQGSLDLFVAGWFQPRGGVLGERDRPSATRVYVHEQPMPGPTAMLGELVSNFYGPAIGVQAFGVLRRGSMVVRDLIVSDSLRVEYDPRVTDSAACGAP